MMDLGLIARSLRADGWDAFAPPPWLSQSWQAPEPFFDELVAWHDAAVATPLKSVDGGSYNLFHDLVLRHLDATTPALVWYDGAHRRQSLSFRALAWAAGERANAWHEAGLRAGQRVALVRTFGPELVISLLAALKLGAIISIVAPSGRRLLRARLAALAPAFLDAQPGDDGDAGATVTRLPCPAAGRGGAALEHAHSYAPGQPLALLFDAALAEHAPRTLTADAAWLAALRDGAIALGLRPGDALAAPALPLTSSQPALIFAALASGATLVHLTLDELTEAPELLVEQPLALLGVSVALRELLRRRPTSLAGTCASWFRDPLESLRLEPWQDFVTATALQAAPALNLAWQSALGGATLFSPRRLGRAHCELLPGAGAAWSLVDLAHADVAVREGAGRLAFSPRGAPAAIVTPAILLPHGRGWMCAGAVTALPRGRAFPVAEALATAATVEDCHAATVVFDPSAVGEPARVVLLCFGAAVAPAPMRLHEELEAALGAEQLPDELACFPLFPRRDDDGAPDARWCHQQYRDGALARKSRAELHLLLSRLRQRVVLQAKELP